MEKSFQVSDVDRKVLGTWTNNPYVALNSLLTRPGLVLNIRSGTKIYQYQQLSEADIIRYPKYKSYDDIFQRLAPIIKMKIFNQPLLDDMVVGHGYAHGYRVARLVMIESLMRGYTQTRSEALMLAAFIHDIGRSWANLNDENHGGKSVQLFTRLLNSDQLTSRLVNERLFNGQLPNITEDDIEIIISIVKNHSRSVPEKADRLIDSSLVLREASDESILEDCDALDRIRFKNNLNINFLRNKESFRLFLLASKLISLR